MSGFDRSRSAGAARRAYTEFVRSTAPSRDAFYTDEIVRFELRDADVLVLPADVHVHPAEDGVLIESESSRAAVAVSGLAHSDAVALLRHVDATRTVRQLRTLDSFGAFQRIVDACFGKVLFAPFAVMDLERRLSAREIVRYPGSPYEVVRPYWENQIDVATRIDGLEDPASDSARLSALLSELHVLSLTGKNGKSFYAPNSPIVRKSGVLPGELFEEPPVLDETGPDILFVSGPRVGAALIGGPLFQELFGELSGDPTSRLGALTFSDDQGVPWGRIVTARAATDAEAAPWFCPPRPILPAHIEAIRSALSRALAEQARGESRALVEALARFHQAFMRLHPFAAGNQSVAMSIVNHLLRNTFGAGIPHLILDHVALRLSTDAYARIFTLAVRGWLVTEGSPAERTMKLVANKRAVFSLFRDLSSVLSIEEARTLVHARPEAARLALLDL